ncbi:hypothetical protein Ancab_021800 [Ancistrocladus abbreviatus]
MQQVNQNRRFMMPGVAPKPMKVAAKPDLRSNDSNKLGGNSKILGGYLAYEYLTTGTLFGEGYGTVAHAHAEAVKNVSEEPKLAKQIKEEKVEERKYKAYVEVANLLKVEGTHLPGIVNPSHLAKYLGM